MNYFLKVCSIVVFSLSLTAQAATYKIAVFDVQKVVDSIADGKKAKTDMEAAVARKKKSLEAQKKKVAQMAQDFERQKLVLDKKVLAEKQRELQELGIKYDRSAMNAQMEMQKMEMELQSKISKKVESVVEKIGRGGQYSMILEKRETGATFVNSTLDITPQVITEYNKAYGKK